MDKKEGKILIIGAGIGQIPLIEKAHKKGYEVIVVSIPGDYPGFKIADECWYIDVFDREKVLAKARTATILAVLSDQNDLMMPTVAFIAEKLGLPGNNMHIIEQYCNKNIYRNNCDILGIPTPKHMLISSIEEIKDFSGRLPWIVKPVDSQSSIGVRKIDRFEEAEDAVIYAMERSSSGQAILEEYFFGREVVCEGFIDDGNYYLLEFADRKYFDLKDLLIPSQTRFPSNLNNVYKDKIVSYEKAMAKHTGARFGIVHSEWLINEDSGEMIPVESALRGGGVYISSHLIPLSTGIDINDVLLEKALGKDIDIDEVFKRKSEKAAAYICFYLPKGIVKSVDGLDLIRSFDFVHKVAVDVKIGEITKPMMFKGQRLGPIIVSAQDEYLLQERIELIKNTLSISVEGDDGVIRNVIWE